MAEEKDILRKEELEKAAGGVLNNYKCERCGNSFPTQELLFDHVCTIVSDHP